MALSTRWCNQCSTGQMYDPYSDTSFCCHNCGHKSFSVQPMTHSNKAQFYALCDWVRPTRAISSDQDFLRIQGIDPEEGY